jgi:hypothetical protein
MENLENIFEKTLKEAGSYRLREMSRLGKLDELKIGQRNPAYTRDNEVEGNPFLPEELMNFQDLIPNSEWWWISSGTNTHNNKGSTSGEGSFEFRFLLNNYFQFICSYDSYIGFTKIKIGFDNIDVTISDPKEITINKMEEIISLNSDKILIFIKENCKINKFITKQIDHLLGL